MKRWGIGYVSCYDTAEEIPDQCKVCFPKEDGREPVMMSEQDMLDLSSREEWYVIVGDHNYGVCDHWISIPFRRWIAERYPKINRYVDKDVTIGYNRNYLSVRLTKDKSFHRSEVWNS